MNLLYSKNDIYVQQKTIIIPWSLTCAGVLSETIGFDLFRGQSNINKREFLDSDFLMF